MVRLGLIGLGGMGNYHANVLSKMENVKIVAVCDIIEQKARTLGEKLKVRFCTDFRDLLDDVDAVWVCTEPFNRREVVAACAGAGKQIFTEKPICLDLHDADEMIAAAKRAKVKYMLGYVLRFMEPYRVIHDTFASGELGELVTCWTRRYMPCDMTRHWYGKQELSGGVTLDFGSHDCDWLRWIGGDVKTVLASARPVRPTVHADEHGMVMMLFARGGMGTLDVSWSSYLNESSIGVVGTTGAMIVGRDGVVRKKVGDGPEQTVDVNSAMDIDPSGNLGTRDAGGNIQATGRRAETIHQHFFRCVEEDVEPLTSAAEGRKTLAVIKAAHLSASCGKAVEVSEVG
ncbi:MAG TPA: Gfo/Idh/MocA family oxidoreductase [Phycisphaerae bacterium]|nr:Gfo/Idh/MocA family oxidoreductase [Phycisphaerae bacterium]